MANDGAIIIKKVKKGGHGGHHGGAWKVAYADFVTAMMAFFLLMWLINTTTPEQKRGIADYFAAQSISQTTSGAGGVLGGMVLGPKGARAAGSMSIAQKQTPPAPSEQTRTKDKAKSEGGNTAAEGKAPASQVQSDNHMQRAVPSAESEEFESAAESIRQAAENGFNLLLGQAGSPEIVAEGIGIYKKAVEAQGRVFDPYTVGVTRALHLATVWQFLTWLGSQTAALQAGLSLLNQHDPANDLHRFVGAVAPHKYRSPERRHLLATARRLLHLIDCWDRTFKERFFPRFATRSGVP